MAFDGEGNQLSTRVLWTLLQDISHESDILAELMYEYGVAMKVLDHHEGEHEGEGTAGEQPDMSPRQAMTVLDLVSERQARWLDAIAEYFASRPIDDLYAGLGKLIAARVADARSERDDR